MKQRRSRLLRLGWLAGWLLAGAVAVRAQPVPNDNLENRRQLILEEQVTSTTVGCTVQRACVSEKTPGNCLKYHNDQWFSFRPPAAGRYFVNIGGQSCRDVRGVQLVVLQGTPCQPRTYRLLSCTSLGTQDDVFVQLDSLRAGQEYLLNVDGYLEDYCRFGLQVSRRARGLPARALPPVPVATLPGRTKVVTISWEVPDSLADVAYCRVLRRARDERRAVEIGRVPTARDTYGRRQPAYALADTLPGPGYFLYQIVAEGATEAAAPPALLRQFWLSFSPVAAPPPGGGAGTAGPWLTLPLSRYPRGSRLRLVLTDPGSGRVLYVRQIVNQPQTPGQNRVLVEQLWLAAGLRRVEAAITCQPRNGRPYTDRLLLQLPAAGAAGR